MLFEIGTFSQDGFVVDKPVNWIKAFREDTDLGLKQSKDVCDRLRQRVVTSDQRTVVLDTNGRDADLRFLDECYRIRGRFTNMVRMVNHPFKAEAGQVEPNKDQERFDETTKVLSNAAIRLIRLGSYKQADEVLKILM